MSTFREKEYFESVRNGLVDMFRNTSDIEKKIIIRCAITHIDQVVDMIIKEINDDLEQG